MFYHIKGGKEKMFLRRKFIWMMVLMVWVGMVTSIIIYQGSDYYLLEETTGENIEFRSKEPANEAQVYYSDQIYLAQGEEADVEKNFFIEYRMERERARSEQINIFREIINNPNTDEATKAEAQKRMLGLTEKMEKEMEIEGLIRARGYQDALAYIHEQAVDIIVQTKSADLDEKDVAIISDVIVKTTGVQFKDVSIIEKVNKNN